MTLIICLLSSNLAETCERITLNESLPSLFHSKKVRPDFHQLAQKIEYNTRWKNVQNRRSIKYDINLYHEK